MRHHRLSFLFVFFLITIAWSTPRYTILLSSDLVGTEWENVADSLATKHNATIINYNGYELNSALPSLQANPPHYLAIVASPEHISSFPPGSVSYPPQSINPSAATDKGGKAFIMNINTLSREIDSDPYGDVIWGVITGYDTEDAMKMVRHSDPVTLNHILHKSDNTAYMNYFPDGDTWSLDVSPYTISSRRNGSSITTSTPGPDDPTEAIVDTLNTNQIDLLITTGHGNINLWQLHYPEDYPEGYIYALPTNNGYNGELIGWNPYSSLVKYINSTNPKAHFAIGNCLTARIDDAANNGSFALSSLRSNNVLQYVGFVEETWFGFQANIMREFFLYSYGRHDFAHSFFLGNQALLNELNEGAYTGTTLSGLQYDRDILAFYGDPAIRFAGHTDTAGYSTRIYEQTLEVRPGDTKDTIVLEAILNRDRSATNPVYYQHPSAVFPVELKNPSLLSTNAPNQIVTDDFIMLFIHSGSTGDVFQLTVLADHDDNIVQTLPLSNTYKKMENTSLAINGTQVSYTLSKDESLTFKIITPQGKTLAWKSTHQQAGEYLMEWNTLNTLKSGSYIILMETQDSQQKVNIRVP
jgi:archaellin